MKKVLVLCLFVLIAFSSQTVLYADDMCDTELSELSVYGDDGSSTTCGGSIGWTTNDPTEEEEPVVLPEHPADFYGYRDYVHMYVGDYFIPIEALAANGYEKIVAYKIVEFYDYQYGYQYLKVYYDVRHEYIGTTGLVLGYFTEPTEFQMRFFVQTEGYQTKEIILDVYVHPTLDGSGLSNGETTPTLDPPSTDTSSGSGLLDELENYDSDYSEFTLEIG